MADTNPHVVNAFIPMSPERCWKAFTDVAMLLSWVPGLRRARVVRAGTGGLPLEVAFEFGATLSYSLVYEHDAEQRIVRWQPRVGRRDGVTGSARFEPEGEGCRVTYSSEPNVHASEERAHESPRRILDAFVAWVGRERRHP